MTGRGNLRENPRRKNFGDDYIVDPNIIEPNHAVEGSSSRAPGVAKSKRDKPRGEE